MKTNETSAAVPFDPNFTRIETTSDKGEVIGVRYESAGAAGAGPVINWKAVGRVALSLVLIAVGFWFGLQVGSGVIA